MSKSWVKVLLPVAIIVAAILVARGLSLFKSHPPHHPQVPSSPTVEVRLIQPAPMQLYVQSQGTVTAKRQIEWASEVAGRVNWVSSSFVEGGLVAAEELLLKLDPTDYKVAEAEALASLAEANLALTEERNEYRRGTNYRANTQQDINTGLRQSPFRIRNLINKTILSGKVNNWGINKLS